jgi:hypothetical protein
MVEEWGRLQVAVSGESILMAITPNYTRFYFNYDSSLSSSSGFS